MIDILFRGKRIETGEWVYGDLQQDISCGKVISNCKWISSHLNSAHSVYPETVGQYTGLRDINGQKIFGGDIIDCNPPWSANMNRKYCMGEVKWEDVTGKWYLDTDTNDWKNGFSKTLLRHAIIIGNIHDNSELIKDE